MTFIDEAKTKTETINKTININIDKEVMTIC